MLVRFAMLVLLLPGTAGAVGVLSVGEFRVQRGDDLRWADPAWPDREWLKLRLGDLPTDPGMIWLRAEVEVPPDVVRLGGALGVIWTALAAHEVYWDGQLIGRGGEVGRSAEEEVPGPVDAHYVVPEKLAGAGPHLVAIRTSSFHRGYEFSNPWYGLFVGDFELLVTRPRAFAWTALMSLSGIVIGALFALGMFLAHRDRAFLVLALLCGAAVALVVAESWRLLVGYTYDHHLTRLVVVTALSWALSFLLVLFVATRFPFRGRGWTIAATAVGLLAPPLFAPGWDTKAGAMLLLSTIVALGLSAAAWRRRASGSLAVLLALVVSVAAAVVAPFRFADLALFFWVDVLLVCLIASHALSWRREIREREVAELKAVRLEIELLRRQIQPHFLMNTLVALAEWIEDDPSTAVRMIDALAEELRILGEVSNRSLIAMGEELRLCKMHLEVMSLRKGRSYDLATEGIDPDAPIPPAVIHTLVENAVTHDVGRTGSRRLTLRAQRRSDGFRYLFESPFGGVIEDLPVREGTGLRYIRMRLQESFGTGWSLVQSEVDGVWRTELIVPRRTL